MTHPSIPHVLCGHSLNRHCETAPYDVGKRLLYWTLCQGIWWVGVSTDSQHNRARHTTQHTPHTHTACITPLSDGHLEGNVNYILTHSTWTSHPHTVTTSPHSLHPPPFAACVICCGSSNADVRARTPRTNRVCGYEQIVTRTYSIV